MANCSIALQILPLEASREQILKTVDAVIDYLQLQEVTLFVGPFETTIEGDFDDLMRLLQESVRRAGAVHASIFANVKINYHERGQVLSIEDKVAKYQTLPSEQ